MTNQPAKRRTSPFIVWPVCLLVFVVLYLASFGPVWSLRVHEKISDETYMLLVNTVYVPFKWVFENTMFFDEHPVGRAYVRYLACWE